MGRLPGAVMRYLRIVHGWWTRFEAPAPDIEAISSVRGQVWLRGGKRLWELNSASPNAYGPHAEREFR